MKTDYVFALDFDGVLCDSAAETATSGWKAGQTLWPDLFAGNIPNTLTDQFCAVRPVLKTGYESILLLRLLMDGLSVDTILTEYVSHKNSLLARLNVDTDELKARFGEARDTWIAQDLEGWLRINTFYDGTIEAVNACPYPVYIVTTKQKRFCNALCNMAGLHIPEAHSFGLETGPKSDTLAKLSRMHQNSTLFFVEDNLQSLNNKYITKLECVRRIFATWGYNTGENRKTAICAENITPITLAEFSDLLANPRNFLS